MFGLMNPGRQDRVFRRAYARCCQHQRRRHGLPSLALLSYESVLLYLCAIDAGKVSLDELPDRTCCRLRRLTGQPSADERQVARYCNAVGLLLAYIKLSDDLRDGPGLLSRLANWLLRNRFRQAFETLRELDPTFEQTIENIIADHLRLENREKSASLEDYAEPTARGFAHVFFLMSRLPGMSDHAEALRRLGQRVGRAIIAYDCAVDWQRDQRQGAYNPLPDGEKAVRDALALARQNLRLAAEDWRRQFGDSAHVARVVEQVARRIPACCESACQRWHSRVGKRALRLGSGESRGFQLTSLPILGGLGSCLGLGLLVQLLAGWFAFPQNSSQPGNDAAKASDVPPGAPVDPNAPAQAGLPGVMEPGMAVPPPSGKKSDCDVVCCECADCPCDGDCGCGDMGCGDCGGCDCNCG